MTTNKEPDASPREEMGIGQAAALSFAGSLLTTAASIVRGKVTAAVLGPVGVGMSSEILQLVTLANVPTGMVTGPALVGRIAENRDDRAVQRVMAGAWTAALTLSTLAAIAATAGARLALPEPWGAGAWSLTALAGLSAALMANITVPTQVLTATGKLPRATLNNLANAMVQMVCVCVGTLALGLHGQFLGLLIAPILLAPLVIRNARAALPGLSWRPSWHIDRQFAYGAMRIGSTSLVTSFAGQSMLVTIRATLEHAGGPALNGQFQAAWSIGTVYFSMLLGSLGNYAFPRYAAAPDPATLQREVEATADFVRRVVPPVLLLTLAFRDVAVRALYNHRFDPAIELLGLLSVGDMSKATVWVYGGPLLYRGRVGAFLFTEILGAAGLALGSVLLVPRLGLLGVGVAYAINSAIALLVTAAVVARACDLRLRWWPRVAALLSTALGLAAMWLSARVAHGRWVVVVVALVWGWRVGLWSSVAAGARRIAGRVLGSRRGA